MRIQLKDHLDRVKKHKAAKEREEQEFQYSGSDDDAPPEDDNRAGEPSSILQAPGENTLRKNFQAIQDSTKAAQAMAEKNFSPGNKPKQEQRRSSRKEEIPEPGPPSRPPIPSVATPPGPPPQRPLPPPPSQADNLRREAERREGNSKPGTPPNQGQRNSRIIQTPVTPNQPPRKPTDQLDELAKHLQDLVPSPGPPRQRDRQRVPSNSNNKPATAEDRDLVEDDSSDDEAPVLRDGTIEASVRNPKPLRDLLPHRNSTGPLEPPRQGPSSQAQQGPGKGPSRPLPPTPDDDGSSNGLRSNMPDLLPQTPTTITSPSVRHEPQSQGSPGIN